MARLRFTNKIKRPVFLLTLFVALLPTLVPAATAALGESDLHSIYNDSAWYKLQASTSFDDSIFCLGGPGGSGPLYGPFFPKVSDTAVLAQSIKEYISTTRPDSPLADLAEA